jgi:YebC/PmpR family DNA-binding regulatory protein
MLKSGVGWAVRQHLPPALGALQRLAANPNKKREAMSGHSKWATIKHKKGAADAKRGKVFTRLIKEISIAAKQGGGDPDGNPRLRTAIAAAKAENMPADNIKRAIQRGTGELEGVSYEEIVYEGYGPGGVAVMVQVLTDNKNRAVSELRHMFSKNNGNLGESGSVGYLFTKKGLIVVPKSAASEEKLTEIALEAGAEDLSEDGDAWEVTTDPKEFDQVLEAIKAAKIETDVAEVTLIPSTYQKLEGTQAAAMMRLLEALEDLDDTQNVYSNFDMDEAAVAAAG